MTDEDHSHSRFDAGVLRWRAGLGLVRDAVRQELVAHQLSTHLPSAPATGGWALDLGCGQGTQAIKLARMGYEVVGVDLSEELLDEARAAASAEPAAIRERVHFQQADALEPPRSYHDRFDVVCCHGVLMYLPSLTKGVDAVVRTARLGGLISVLTRNQAGIAMRAGMTRDWEGALAGFDASAYTNRLGLEQVRADDPEHVAAALVAAGATRVEWYGVRLFSDHWGDVEVGADFMDLLDAEHQVGRRDPFRGVCALTHTLARRTQRL